MDNKLIKNETVLGEVLNVYGTPENPLFIAKDVADWIGHGQPATMVKLVDDDEKKLVQIGTVFNKHSAWMLTEDGLYEVLMQSRKPIAKAFKKEIKRILRELRNHGFTATLETIEKIINNPDLVIRLATELKASRESEKKEKLRADLNEQKVCLANRTIRDQAPKVKYHDDVLGSNSDFTATTLAKETGFRSAIAFNKWMNKEGYQFWQDDHWNLYSKYAVHGYTTTRTGTYRDVYDNKKSKIYMTYTEKGRKWIHDIISNG